MSHAPVTPATPPRRRRVLYFRIVLALFPLLLLLLLEVSLRAFDYGGNPALFMPTSPRFADKEHLIINPRVAARYFPAGYFVPEPTTDGFLREKPANGLRVFVLGESTAAGWPYPNNVMFTRGLQRRLVDLFPNQHVEVVNLGIAAINSFALLDFVDEVLQQQPDAVLIYAGHNEFYGAFGAGSSVSFGHNPSLIRLYLTLQRFKVFVLLRDMVNGTTALVRGAPASAPGAKFRTLMGQVIGQDHIPLGSDVYERGKAQFRGNMDALLGKIRAAGVPVIVSELVSNVRDHAPFFSGRSATPSAAEEAFHNARRLETEGRWDEARAAYYQAKDLDGLRFRAPEDFNAIIHELAEKHRVPVVPMKSYFETASPHGLIGKELMLEHLHPNAFGYRLMGLAFFDTMRKHLYANAGSVTAGSTDDFEGYTELDVAIGKLRILQLTDHWPFKPEAEFSDAAKRYIPETTAEEIAKNYVLQKFGFPEAHVRMAEYYGRRGREQAALREFWALVNSAPLDVEYYLGAARVLIKAGAAPQAWPFLEASLKIRSTDPDTERLLRELSDAYLKNNQTAEARRIFARLQAAAPQHAVIKSLAAKLQ